MNLKRRDYGNWSLYNLVLDSYIDHAHKPIRDQILLHDTSYFPFSSRSVKADDYKNIYQMNIVCGEIHFGLNPIYCKYSLIHRFLGLKCAGKQRNKHTVTLFSIFAPFLLSLEGLSKINWKAKEGSRWKL